MNKIYIGIDISKKNLDIFVQSKYLKFKNDESGFKKLLKKITSLEQQVHCICESTGNYQLAMALFLADNNIDISIVNPLKTKRFIQSFGEGAKTDKIDAQMLSIFGEKMNPSIWIPPTQAQLDTRSLIKRREHLVEMRKLELQHLESEYNKTMIKSIKKSIKFFDMQIAEIESEIDENIDNDDEMKSKREILEEVKGIGRVSACNLLLHLPELGTISRGAIAAIVGVAPYNRDSGSKSGKRQIRGGRKQIRDKLYMPTLRAIATNEIIKEYYLRLKSKGKAFKVILIACMRKLLIHLNAKMKAFNNQTSISA